MRPSPPGVGPFEVEDVGVLIGELDALVAHAPSARLVRTQIVLDRESVYDVLDRMRLALPETIRGVRSFRQTDPSDRDPVERDDLAPSIDVLRDIDALDDLIHGASRVPACPRLRSPERYVRAAFSTGPWGCRSGGTHSPNMSSQHDDREQDHPDIVRQEYADPSRFAARWALWSRRTGPSAYDVAFDALLKLEPKRVIELGCGPGDFAARVQAAGIELVAFDQSQQMVDLARARGTDARIGTVEAIPSVEGAFDAAVANFMLYHVVHVDRALGEIARVAPALVAATMGYDQLREMWNLVGRDLGRRQGLFMRETGGQLLRAHYANVRMVDLPATVEMSADDMRNYIANSVAHRHLASRVPDFDGTRTITASTAVFIASNPS